jgi:hypothetical protein
VLVVELRGAAFAIPATLVREVAPAAPVTPLPGTEPWVLGLSAVRGALLPVGDLARRAAPDGDAAPTSDARDGRGARLVVLDDGRRAAAFVGLRVRGVALARAVDDAPHVDGAPRDALVVHGLPVRGAVRLLDDGRPGAGAGPVHLARRSRARDAARAAPAPREAPAGDIARLDVTALLDDLLDQGG